MKEGHKEAHDELKLGLSALRSSRTHIRYAMNLHPMPPAARESLAFTLMKIAETEQLLVRDFVKARSRSEAPSTKPAASTQPQEHR